MKPVSNIYTLSPDDLKIEISKRKRILSELSQMRLMGVSAPSRLIENIQAVESDVERLEARLKYEEETKPLIEYVEKLKRSAKAKKAASISHKENRSIKKEALEYYINHHPEYKSKRAAAKYIAGKIVPVKWRTVYSWIRQYSKSG